MGLLLEKNGQVNEEDLEDSGEQVEDSGRLDLPICNVQFPRIFLSFLQP